MLLSSTSSRHTPCSKFVTWTMFKHKHVRNIHGLIIGSSSLKQSGNFNIILCRRFSRLLWYFLWFFTRSLWGFRQICLPDDTTALICVPIWTKHSCMRSYHWYTSMFRIWLFDQNYIYLEKFKISSWKVQIFRKFN